VVLIDPIATNLHHSRSTREVVFTRVDSLQASFEDFVFKKELWTSSVVARHLPWHEASWWLDECVPQTPTLIAVGSMDTIINPAAASTGFGTWQARLRGVRVLAMEGMGHGEWLVSEEGGAKLVASVQALRQEAADIGAAEAAARTVASTASEATLKASKATRKASATLAAAAGPLASSVTPLATTYAEAVAEAELARGVFEEGFTAARPGGALKRDIVKAAAAVAGRVSAVAAEATRSIPISSALERAARTAAEAERARIALVQAATTRFGSWDDSRAEGSREGMQQETDQ